MPYRHDTGCRCRDCFGLAEHMHHLTGKDYGLPAAPGHKPTSIQLPGDKAACDNTLTCQCDRCTKQRHELTHARRRDIRQPWDTRPARAA